jgi:hypothetical protein
LEAKDAAGKAIYGCVFKAKGECQHTGKANGILIVPDVDQQDQVLGKLNDQVEVDIEADGEFVEQASADDSAEYASYSVEDKRLESLLGLVL